METSGPDLSKQMTRRGFLMLLRGVSERITHNVVRGGATSLHSLIPPDQERSEKIWSLRDLACSFIHAEHQKGSSRDKATPSEKEPEARFGDLEISDKEYPHNLHMRTSGRFGGSIVSIKVRGKEVVDPGDSGRLVQPAGHDCEGIETFNFTFGGASPEYGGPTAQSEGTVQSKVLSAGISLSGRSMRVVTRPAFWKPLNKSYDHDQLNLPDKKFYQGTLEQWSEVNPTDTNGHKHVGVVRMKVVADMPVIPGTKFATMGGGLAMEMPTIYTDSSLTRMYWLQDSLLSEDKTLDPQNFPPRTYSVIQTSYEHPCVAASKNGEHAIGQIRLPRLPPKVTANNKYVDPKKLFPHQYYSMYRYAKGDGSVGKMNIVGHQPDVARGDENIAKLMPPGDLHIEYETYIVTGTLAEVRERMIKLQESTVDFSAWEEIDMKEPQASGKTTFLPLLSR